jgi:hypothetical protein
MLVDCGILYHIITIKAESARSHPHGHQLLDAPQSSPRAYEIQYTSGEEDAYHLPRASLREQQREYLRLSGLLQQICIRYRQELPDGTTSVLLTNPDHKVRIQAYDRAGRPIGIIPNDKTSSAFQHDLEESFGNVISPDRHGILALI